MLTNTSSALRPVSRRLRWVVGVLLLFGGAIGLRAFAQNKRTAKIDTWGFQVIASYPHDPVAFTQGLVFKNNQLFEGTGKLGESSLRRVDLATGAVEKIAPLNHHYFGEGITILDNRIYQLTWQNRLGIVYDLTSFQVEKTFQFTGEGWGLTNDGKYLIMSDGSSTIRFLDPKTFTVVRRITVRGHQGKVERLNELEFVKNEIWANVWYQDTIVRISPETGEVLGWVDLSNLYPRTQRRSNEDVLNGIAYDPDSDRLLVTGKNWPHLFEIKVGPK
ncbi:glutaminyl-peptide cyclotransferase [Schlesneria paludicola]|uniref:glutaminyl-peptide cyclotransferase n=1 Tax=Schlesneria paludicola TaxID=360056 RepID=UPI00058BE820|nr:glutaminyl-peptide cyclotransferase [Schlesneria paludicola]